MTGAEKVMRDEIMKSSGSRLPASTRRVGGNTYPAISATRQRGATLIVALVILAVVTLLGVTSIRSSSLELKMAASARDRSVAFQAAEAALLTIERNLMTAPPRRSALLPGCDPAAGVTDPQARCFVPECSLGHCFTGRFAGTTQNSDCRLADASGMIDQPWKNPDLWSQPESHAVVNVARTDLPTTSLEVKYLIEFMCFVLPQEITSLESNGDPFQEAVPLYRVTVLAEGEAQRASVMLQTTITVPEA